MKLLLATTALALTATSLAAQGFSGATITLDHQTFSDLDNFDSTRLSGSFEYDLGSGFAVAADLGLISFTDFDEDLTILTVHGIYAVSPDARVGLFIGRESSDILEIDAYGVEGAYDFSGFGVQGYVGAGEVADGFFSNDFDLLGVSADYALGNGVFFKASYDELTVQDIGVSITYSSTQVGGGYALSSGISAEASFGQFEFTGGGSPVEQDFIKISLSYGFGAQGGTTFDTVGFFETLRFPDV